MHGLVCGWLTGSFKIVRTNEIENYDNTDVVIKYIFTTIKHHFQILYNSKGTGIKSGCTRI